MKDTTAEIEKKQRDLFMAKSPGERLAICLEMTDFARALVETRIKSKHPNISGLNLKAEVFKHFYKNDFKPDELEKIAHWLSLEQVPKLSQV